MNIFEKAVKKEQPKAKGASKVKTVVPVKLGDKLTRLNEVRAQMENLKAQEADLVSSIKPVGEDQFLKLYGSQKLRPESFILQSDDGGKILYITTDKYAKLEEGTEETIKEIYKDQAAEIIEKQTEFKFDAEILSKHADKISAALAALDIPEEDKDILVKATTKMGIKKGTIERLITFPNYETLYKLIKPTVQLKNQK